MRKDRFDVTGMSCAACSARVEKSVSKLAGIKDVSVNLLKNSMTVEYDENALTADGIIEAVVNAGYGASLREEKEKPGVKTKTAPSPVDVAKQEYEKIWRRLMASVGTYDGMASPGVFPRDGERYDFRAYALSSDCSNHLHQF